MCAFKHVLPQAAGRCAGRATARSVQEQQEDDPAAGKPGGGVVGLFVAGWMALLALIMQLLSPVFSLSLFVAQPLTNTNPVRARAVVDKWVSPRHPELSVCGHQHTNCTTQRVLMCCHVGIVLKAPPYLYCWLWPPPPTSTPTGHSAAAGVLGTAALRVGASTGEVYSHYGIHCQLECAPASHSGPPVGSGWCPGQHHQLPHVGTTAAGHR